MIRVSRLRLFLEVGLTCDSPVLLHTPSSAEDGTLGIKQVQLKCSVIRKWPTVDAQEDRRFVTVLFLLFDQALPPAPARSRDRDIFQSLNSLTPLRMILRIIPLILQPDQRYQDSDEESFDGFLYAE